MAKESIETLITELVHEEDWRRMRAMAACVQGGTKAVQALIHALETGGAGLKTEIAGMLARLKDRYPMAVVSAREEHSTLAFLEQFVQVIHQFLRAANGKRRNQDAAAA